VKIIKRILFERSKLIFLYLNELQFDISQKSLASSFFKLFAAKKFKIIRLIYIDSRSGSGMTMDEEILHYVQGDKYWL
jgi:hypothetical protein